MTETTTVRIDRDVHARIVRLAAEGNQQLMDAIRDAVETLERARFAARVGQQMAQLASDESSLDAYLTDGELATADGIA
jgi:predicted transcriptional regulator